MKYWIFEDGDGFIFIEDIRPANNGWAFFTISVTGEWDMAPESHIREVCFGPQ